MGDVLLAFVGLALAFAGAGAVAVLLGVIKR